jgi:hypothetical protein
VKLTFVPWQIVPVGLAAMETLVGEPLTDIETVSAVVQVLIEFDKKARKVVFVFSVPLETENPFAKKTVAGTVDQLTDTGSVRFAVRPWLRKPNEVSGVLDEDTCHDDVLLSAVVNMHPARFVMVAIEPLQLPATTPDAAGNVYPLTPTASTIVAPDKRI